MATIAPWKSRLTRAGGRRELLLLAAVALAGVALSGCGRQPAEVAEAAVKTADAGTARFSVRVAIDGGLSSTEMRGSGVIDVRRRRGSLLFDLPCAPFPGGPRFSEEESRLEEVFAASRIYLRGSLFDRVLPKGRKWVEIDLERSGSVPGVDLSGLSELSQGDPRQTLDLLRAVSDDVEAVGEKRVRGAATTHYRATVDLGRYPALLPPAERPRARRTVEQLTDLLGTRELPLEAWVDDAGLVRRTRQSFPLRADGLDLPTNVTVEVEYFDFGTDVAVEVPRDRETVPIERVWNGGLPSPRPLPGGSGLPRIDPPRRGSKLPRIDLPPGSVNTCNLRPD